MLAPVRFGWVTMASWSALPCHLSESVLLQKGLGL